VAATPPTARLAPPGAGDAWPPEPRAGGRGGLRAGRHVDLTWPPRCPWETMNIRRVVERAVQRTADRPVAVSDAVDKVLAAVVVERHAASTPAQATRLSSSAMLAA
jgi:hypothetical protein